MTLDQLLEEIRSHGDRALVELTERADTEKRRLEAERDRQIAALRSEIAAQGEAAARRERTQRVAAARMQARKAEYEARERALTASLASVRDLLQKVTETDEYDLVLRRMFALAADRLGAGVRVSGRAEDAARLKSLAGKGFQSDPRPILGGLVAESADGARRLDLSFDELLRLRGDRLRELLA